MVRNRKTERKKNTKSRKKLDDTERNWKKPEKNRMKQEETATNRKKQE